MAPYVAKSVLLEHLSIMSFIMLKEAWTQGPVKIDSAALTILEKLG